MRDRRRLRVRHGNAVIEGRLPPTQVLRLLVRVGLGVHVLRMPEGLRTLDFLAPLGPSLRRLVVTDHRCADMSALATLPGLEDLVVTPAPSGSAASFANLPRLRRYAGPWSEVLDPVLASDTLVQLTLERPPRDLAHRLTAPLGALHLLSARTLSAVPVLRCRSTLQTLEIAGGRHFDLTGVERYQRLQHLVLYGRTPVTGAGALRLCRALRRLHLEECYRLDDPAALEALDLEQFLLIGRPQGLDPALIEGSRHVRARVKHMPPGT